jgi:hypothetical protein
MDELVIVGGVCKEVDHRLIHRDPFGYPDFRANQTFDFG